MIPELLSQTLVFPQEYTGFELKPSPSSKYSVFERDTHLTHEIFNNHVSNASHMGKGEMLLTKKRRESAKMARSAEGSQLGFG